MTFPQVALSGKIKKFPEYSAMDTGLKEDFSLAYKLNPPATSDVAFNTLFGWGKFFSYRVSTLAGFLFVHYLDKGKMTVISPLQAETFEVGAWGARFAELADALSGYCAQNSLNLEFEAVPEARFKDMPPGKFTMVDDKDYYDYVYRKADLALLEGRVYAAKRNLIRQFEKNYSWKYEPLNAGNLEACRQFVWNWDVTAAKSGVTGIGAYCTACRLMEHFATLDLCGGLLYAGGELVAVTVATIVWDFSYESGTVPTAVVHHERGLTQYKGVYQMINKQFAASLPPSVVYVNREEDLGLPGLRKAKLSYNPAIMLKKYRLSLR